ncbi:MAG: 4-(cytidine 5'-diphospho)-2-C-methyl-D-erythritol kinase [Burkholderiales bacterium]|nr:4-(cytidine 5'-diphospho)-2-C-methyl-D-erythritol kinase [Burkholderiales bacterium]
MNALQLPAPAKLNLFLHVVGRRADGYHLLESVFQLLDVGDSLAIRVRADGVIRRLTDLPGVPEEADLVVRAARLLQAETGTGLGAEIAVDKRVPLGGGLGGGSSDAATTLLALNRLWDAGLSRAQLARIGLALGADVPFFIFGRNAFARGIGEDLLAVTLPERWYAVAVPPVAVPTARIFGAPELTRNSKSVKIADFSSGAWSFPGPQFRNDLEPVACAQFEQVARTLDWLRGFDARAVVSARMSGSGASVFAGFASQQGAAEVIAGLPAGCRGFVARGIASHPLAGCARD